jgi:hypothetical protein
VLRPRSVAGAEQAGGNQWWIFYNNRKVTGKNLVVRPGGSYTATDAGAYNLLAWSGTGTIGGQEVRGGEPAMDELLVVHDAATRGVPVVNTGTGDLVVFTFFGPDINLDAPAIEPWVRPPDAWACGREKPCAQREWWSSGARRPCGSSTCRPSRWGRGRCGSV